MKTIYEMQIQGCPVCREGFEVDASVGDLVVGLIEINRGKKTDHEFRLAHPACRQRLELMFGPTVPGVH